jgi:gas vesicle protein
MIEPKDFDAYMQFHSRRLLKDEFQLTPFSNSIRRTINHSPEGTLRIEQETTESTQPIYTLRRSAAAELPMQFPLSAASTLSFKGDRHLHMWLSHSFSLGSIASLNLNTQARQFSSFILVVGRVLSQTELDPKHAIIVQNKDELNIPLLLEVIPTAKEFRDAIQSLSEEQKKFARAIRSMQLGGTVFGIAVIQIKPHMEKVLNLPPDSLTKEIALSQDLMEMFIKYQIPTDLLSFNGDSTESAHSRVSVVKGYVGAIKDMIQKAKEDEVQEKKMLNEANREKERASRNEGMKEGVEGMSEQMAPPRMKSGRDSMESMTADTVMDSSFASSSSGDSLQRESLNTERITPGKTEENPQSKSTNLPAHANILKGDYSSVPAMLDLAHDTLDPDSPMRATLIKLTDGGWRLKSRRGLLQPETEKFLYKYELKTFKNEAFDLLDALSKSGALVLDHAELHIIFASTHAFDKSVMDTVVKDNVNPIDRAERSLLIMASTLHGLPASALIENEYLPKLKISSPLLFLNTSTSPAA